jgi:hypothetical protein
LDRHVLFSAQRNEGPFIFEWLAYHLVLGFDRFVVVSNDCTDGSCNLLDRLARHLPLDHIVQTVEGPNAPQHQAQHIARDTGLLRSGDFVCWLDADGFLNIHAGAGYLDDLRAGRGDGSVAGDYLQRIARRYSARHYRSCDRNFLRDATIRRHSAAVSEWLSHLLSKPDVAKAHAACLAPAGLDPGIANR